MSECVIKLNERSTRISLFFRLLLFNSRVTHFLVIEQSKQERERNERVLYI